jgi:hypothetical protein
MIEVHKPARPIPAWLTVLVVVAALAAGAWFLRALWQGSGPRERIVILDKAPGEGVTRRGDGRYAVRGGAAWLGVEKNPKGDVSLEFRFDNTDFMGRDVVDVLTKTRRIVSDAAFAREMGVTPQQLAALRQVRQGAKIELPAPDAAQLKTLFAAYEAAAAADPKAADAAETALTKALEAVGKKLEGPTRQGAAERAAKARAALTPEQWAKFDQVGT